jgi:hypothetical protein
VTWHILDARSVWIKEFSAALAKRVPVLGWVPQMSWTGAFSRWEKYEELKNPDLPVRHFLLQRGYSQAPISWIARPQVTLMRHLLNHSENPSTDTLVCTTPFYAPVAERWPGPVVYYLTDLTKGYAGANPDLVVRMDLRMCRVADLVCPNSQRIANYLKHEAKCSPDKIVVVPNATRAMNVYPACPVGPGALPADLQGLPRPLAGVIGNLAQNMDWLLLKQTFHQNPDLQFVFVGPTDMEVFEPAQRDARHFLMNAGKRAFFTGSKPYGQLRDYARCFDVAILPYQPAKEPTYSGSSTRFYEHLAACRPMLATRGFEELLHKEPLLKLVDQPEDLTAALGELQRLEFQDGYEQLRWEQSKQGTWENRAATIITELIARGEHAVQQPEFMESCA